LKTPQTFKYPREHLFNNETLLNDIVLVELAVPFVFSSSVQPGKSGVVLIVK
jgi:hypothetical protein